MPTATQREAELDRPVAPPAGTRPPVPVPMMRPAPEIKLVASREERPSLRMPASPGAGKVRPDYRQRALALWPRLDAARLRRTGGEAVRIARLVERRTALPFEIILGMLKRHD